MQTRAEILAAARELLLEVGPEELSLRQVARRADFSPAALYNYFSSRDEIVASLVRGGLRPSRRLSAAGPFDPEPGEASGGTGLAYMDFARENPMDLRCMLLSTSLDLPPSSGKAVGMGAAQLIGETFREGMEQGLFATDGPLSAAEMAYGLWALVQGMVSIAAIDLSEVSEEISADPRRVIEAFVGMLTPQGAPAREALERDAPGRRRCGARRGPFVARNRIPEKAGQHVRSHR